MTIEKTIDQLLADDTANITAADVIAGLTRTIEYLSSVAGSLAIGHDMKAPKVADCLRWADMKFAEVKRNAEQVSAAEGA